jgi:hypothetical protein
MAKPKKEESAALHEALTELSEYDPEIFSEEGGENTREY